jgi:hypothetical protein
MGRAVLRVLTEFPYDGQAVVFCSRFGEFTRSLEMQHELAREGSVSPQQFSMAVHNANGGLFMMAQKSRAPLTALSAQEETALAGLQEAYIQLAGGAAAVWLIYGDEPLPADYRLLSAMPDDRPDYFASLFELAAGDDFRLCSDPAAADFPTAAPLDVLRFFLRPQETHLCLSSRGGWTLRRQGPEVDV